MDYQWDYALRDAVVKQICLMQEHTTLYSRDAPPSNIAEFVQENVFLQFNPEVIYFKFKVPYSSLVQLIRYYAHYNLERVEQEN